MNLKGRRQSTNVDDRRGKGGKIAIGGGILGVIVAGLMVLLNGGDLGTAVQQAVNSAQGGQSESYTPSTEEEQLAVFAKQVLASTEDV